MMPIPPDVAAFLGQDGDAATVALAEQALPIVTAMARSYTRDRGFTGLDPAEDVAAVLVTATARMITNPGQIAYDLDGLASVRGGFTGWSLAELFVLNRYRKRAA